jgi:hypothetical protein
MKFLILIGLSIVLPFVAVAQNSRTYSTEGTVKLKVENGRNTRSLTGTVSSVFQKQDTIYIVGGFFDDNNPNEDLGYGSFDIAIPSYSSVGDTFWLPNKPFNKSRFWVELSYGGGYDTTEYGVIQRRNSRLLRLTPKPFRQYTSKRKLTRFWFVIKELEIGGDTVRINLVGGGKLQYYEGDLPPMQQIQQLHIQLTGMLEVPVEPEEGDPELPQSTKPD